MFDFLNAAVLVNLICLAMMAFVVLVIFFTSEDISRIGALLLGVGLIAQAGWTAYEIQTHWLALAETMAAPKVAAKYRISSDQLQTFSNLVSFSLWIIPFVTASWGTNIISDAAARNFTYREKWMLPSYLARGAIWFLGALWSLLTLPARLCDHSSSREADVGENIHPRAHWRRSSRALINLLADLPQFNRDEGNDTLVNMLDGSIIDSVSLQDDEFGCYLSVKWSSNSNAVRVDGARYVRLQIRAAEMLGHDTTRMRHKAERSIEDILGN